MLWTKNGIHFILRNEVYAGVLVWDAYAEDNAEPVRVERAFHAIISKARFHRVNKLARPERSISPAKETTRRKERWRSSCARAGCERYLQWS